MDSTISVEAEPYEFVFTPRHTALVVIDMQRDFLLDGGYGACQEAASLTDVQAAVPHVQKLLSLFREANMTVLHTREGHTPDLSDCPSSKLLRNLQCRPEGGLKIGDEGPMGRLLCRGEYGHDIVDELQPIPGEVVIDKPGKGAFWDTPIMDELRARAITHLVFCGVTTECCFTTTIREANDRGFECCGVIEATAGYVPEFKTASLDMLSFAGGLFGFTASLDAFVTAFSPKESASTNGHVTNGALNGVHHESDTSWDGDMSINGLRAFYKRGGSIGEVIRTLYDKIKEFAKTDNAVWIHLVPPEVALKDALGLEDLYPNPLTRPPLYGIPFNVKDSIDVVSIPTTTACPPLTHIPSETAPVVQKALAAGAIFIGKANLDQFATGLSGARSPYGMLHSVFSPSFISGGSSSGSAVSVGAGLCSFSIATDTAGSGRVPAGFNGVVGFKPTRGTLSTVGLVPACPSLDCIAIIAATPSDAREVWNHVRGYDARDPYAKWAVSRPRPIHSLGPQRTAFRFGTPPPEVLSICCPTYQRQFRTACARLRSVGGIEVQAIDWSPFQKAGDLLYDGTFVSERLATLPDGWVEQNAEQLHPVVLKLLRAVEARQSTAVQAYRDMMAKAQYTRQSELVFRPGEGGIDVLVVPTAPIHWTIAEMEQEPIVRNAFLGTFTHCGNVLDLCAVSVPAGTYRAAELGERCPSGSENVELPFGVTLLGMSGTDAEVLEWARRFVAGESSR